MSENAMNQRRVLAIKGADRLSFLQGLVTKDVEALDDRLVYAALLTPQGKYLADFFLTASGERILLDVAEPLADALIKRLSMYRLRADVEIAASGLTVSRGTGAAPDGTLPDPRHDALGWRLYSTHAMPEDGTDWDAIRVAHCIPESGVELLPDESYILESGFERLNGVDFRKGCYVGQEVTARMKHKTALKKGLATVEIDGSVPVGTEITAQGKPVGRVFTQSGGRAIAYLRFDRAAAGMQAAGAGVAWTG